MAITKAKRRLITRLQRAGGGGPSALQLLGGATYTIDGSKGQTYSAPAGMTGIQWYQKALATPYGMTQIAGATASTYISQAGDIGTRLVARGTLNGVLTDAISLMPVLDIPVLLDDYESLTGRTATGTGTVLSLDTTDKLRGTSSLVVTTGTASGNNGSGTTPTLDPSQLGVVVVAAKRGPDTFTQFTESIVKGAQSLSAPFANLDKASQEWKYLAIDTASTFVGATSGVTTFRDWQSLPVGTPSIIAKYDAKLSKAKGHPTVKWSNDDGYADFVLNILPYMQQRGFVGDLFWAPNLLTGAGSGDSKYAVLADAFTAYNAGWDWGCDSGMNDESLQGLTPDQSVTQFAQVQDWAISNGFVRGIDGGCYSMGQWTDDQGAALLASGRWKAFRGTDPGTYYTRFGFLTGTQRVYPSMGFSAATPSTYATQLAQAKAYVDFCVATGSTISFHLHYSTEGTGAIGVPRTAVLYPLVDYVASYRDRGLLDVLTGSQQRARDGIGPRFPV